MTGDGDKPVDKDLAALEELGFVLDPWQRRLLAAVETDPDGPLFHPPSRARMSGNVAYQREVIRRELAAGKHVHVVTADPRGITCPGGQCTPEQLQRRSSGWGAANAGDPLGDLLNARELLEATEGAWPPVYLDEWSRANPPLRSVDAGGWEPAQPIPVRGLVGRLEAAAARRGWTRLATWLGNFDERKLGK